MTMQSFFQEPGFLPFANLGMADAMEVDRVITWRYVSTRGVLHRLDGCGPQSDLAGWISRVEELEAHLEEVDRNAGWNRDQEAIMLQRYGAGAKPIPTGTPRASED
jgi:hypothetical protein